MFYDTISRCAELYYVGFQLSLNFQKTRLHLVGRLSKPRLIFPRFTSTIAAPVKPQLICKEKEKKASTLRVFPSVQR